VSDTRPLSNQCSAKVWSGWSHYPCSKKAKVNRNGKDYCGIHDPQKVAARNAKQEAKWDAQRRLNAMQFAVRLARENAIDTLKEISPDNLTEHPALKTALEELLEAESKLAAQNPAP
jgi:hypothetical protein